MERRIVAFSDASPNQEELAGWVINLPGRLFSLAPYPGDTRVWMAVTLEDQ